ncbi:MAG: LytTR family DNA-binding domain-containing protein [Bacteroidales bacterium]|jgi:DNA-binding LytR/AlgR family response regulator|nr:LytTR family DNA-binding domain-containing protein [Bacteroidales bacterium]
MRVLIIEDEKPASLKLQRMLYDLDDTITIAAILESVEGSSNWFLNNPPPDLVFMDIQLDDGLCFEIFENININIPVIFTTAYDEYAIRAFRVNSVDYLLKPIKAEDLGKAVDKFRKIHGRKRDDSIINSLLKQMETGRRERFLIKIGQHYRPVQVADIHYFYIREGCAFISRGGGRDYAIDFSLDRLEQMLDPKRFYRVNRNYIVNINAIKDIIAYSSSRLKLILDGQDENHDVVVSRDRVADFKKWMDR